MRAKMLNENGGYPPGAEYDKNAPWNEPEDHSYIEVKADDDYIRIVRSEQTSEEDSDEIDSSVIDYADFFEFLAKKINIDEEEIDLTSITESGNEKYEAKITIKMDITLKELYDLAEKTHKRHSKFHKK